MFKMVLKGRLVEFLGLQGVITPGRYRFRSGYSMAIAIQDMVQRARAQDRPIHPIQNIGAQASGGAREDQIMRVERGPEKAKSCAPERPWKVVYGCVPVTPREM
jgi:hypothetical protein